MNKIEQMKKVIDDFYKEMLKIEKPKNYKVGGTYYGGTQLFSSVGNHLDKLDDEDYYNERNMFLEKKDMKFYSYDITEHLIGIFDVRTEELITIIEYDFVKIMCNIKNNLLFLFEKNLNTLKSNQFAIEAFYHYYFDNLDETPASLDYTRDKYLAFLSLDDGFKIIQENFNYDNITCILEVDEGYLAVGSLKKGLVLYSN